ncbi:M50 family metallopeptidase [Candidatus Woesearchaeota archaeon]|nr:M50 family metallopeptidase [Candidatus Woesearchaeota archaeon]
MLFTLKELFDIIIMTLAVGYIFKDMFIMRRQATHHYDPLEYYRQPSGSNFKFAIIAAAPAIILHELGHKFTALAFGMSAEFHAAYFWLLLGVVLKLINFGFIFFVPAYVQWGCPTDACLAMVQANPWVGSVIAFAGPAINGLLWLGAWIALRQKWVAKKYVPLVIIMKYINGFLFIFNLLPIPGFDGFHFFKGLVSLFL